MREPWIGPVVTDCGRPLRFVTGAFIKDLLDQEGDPASAAGGLSLRKFQSLRRNDPDQVQGSRRISRISAPRRGSPRNGRTLGRRTGLSMNFFGRACVACGPPLGLECPGRRNGG